MNYQQIFNNNKKMILVLLSVIILWRFVSSSCLLILAALFVYWSIQNDKETFDKDMTEFIPVGEPRYGLRGEKMPIRPIYDCRFDCYTDCYNSNI